MKIKTPEERDASDGQRETSEARKRLFQSEKITTISKPSVDSLTLWSGINKKKKKCDLLLLNLWLDHNIERVSCKKKTVVHIFN
jgi:hypothetical protein